MLYVFFSFTDCGVLSVPNGEANTTLGTSIGAIATVKCDEGYNLNGHFVVVCTTSGWNDSLLACVIQGTINNCRKHAIIFEKKTILKINH